MPRSRFVLLLSAGLILAVIACIFITVDTIMSRDTHNHRPDVVKLFGGEAAYSAVVHPSKVEAFRVEPKPDGDYAKSADYADISGPASLTPELVTVVSKALTSPDSYDWDSPPTPKGCITRYVVRFAFHQDPRQVDVYLCFGCNDLLVVSDDKQQGKDFFRIRPALVMAVRRIFPSDPAIQKLGE